jgi:hypothetical protein
VKIQLASAMAALTLSAFMRDPGRGPPESPAAINRNTHLDDIRVFKPAQVG